MTAGLSSSDIFLSYRYSVISARSFTEYKVSSIVATILFAVFNSLSLRISDMYSLPSKTRTFSNRSITCVLLQRVEKLAEHGVLGFLPCRNGVPKSFKVSETVRLPPKLDLCLPKSRFSVIGHTTTTAGIGGGRFHIPYFAKLCAVNKPGIISCTSGVSLLCALGTAVLRTGSQCIRRLIGDIAAVAAAFPQANTTFPSACILV